MQSLLLLLNAVYLAKKQQTPILWSIVWPNWDSYPQFDPHSRQAGLQLHHWWSQQ